MEIRKRFSETVDWKKFVKIICIVSVIVGFNMIFMPMHDWWFAILIIVLTPLWLLTRSHADYIIKNEKKTLNNIKEIRAEKLRRLKKHF